MGGGMIGSSSAELEVEIVSTYIDGALVTVVVTTVSIDTASGAIKTAEIVVWLVTGVSVVNGWMMYVLAEVNAASVKVVWK